MVEVKLYGNNIDKIDFTPIEEKGPEVSKKIAERSGLGSDFLGWIDYASTLSKEEIEHIVSAAKRIRENYDTLVVCGIGGSYLGARAVIETLNGLFSDDDFEIIYFGNTLSPDYSAQVLKHLKKRKFAVNVISKSGTTTETAVAFRLLKQLLIEKYGIDGYSKAVFATSDKSRGALKAEANNIGYDSFVIPDDVGGRYSVITPVGLLPIAVAGIDIRSFINGVISGEKDYSASDFRNNPAYYYGAIRYLMNFQYKKTSEMFVTYNIQYQMLGEWFKQLFDESEGKDYQGLLCTSATFTTDLHSMGQFIQQGSKVLFETVLNVNTPNMDVIVPSEENNYDNLNYLAGRKLSDINSKAARATLDAHSSADTPVVMLNVDKLDAYTLGNLIYFFFKACAFSAYLLDVNPFNQPGVEVYKRNMFKLLGKPSYTD